MAKSKKDFKGNNPALEFITVPEEEQQEDTRGAAPAPELPEKPPKGYKLDPRFIETKSKRVQLLMQPSIVTAAKEYAATQGLSMNELVALALKEYLAKYSK